MRYIYKQLDEAFSFHNIQIAGNRNGVTRESLLTALCQDSMEEAATLLGYTNRGGLTQFLKRCYPNKPSNVEWVGWLLNSINYQYCEYCMKAKHLDYFPKTEKVAKCLECGRPESRFKRQWYMLNRDYRTVLPEQKEKIKEIYKNCPEGYHVDHVIPLNGALVSGLHVVENLQYLPARENIQKSNNYHVE